MMTIPVVVLRGEWPPRTPGFTHLPPDLIRDSLIKPVSFGLFAQLASYAQEGLPVPAELLAESQFASALTGLIPRWAVLVPDNRGAISEIHLRHAPGQ